jgi:hypothetical protein
MTPARLKSGSWRHGVRALDTPALPPTPVRPPASGLLLFLVVGLAVTLVWTNWAETEARRAYASIHSYNSIVALVDGTAPAPFAQRRLFPDLTRLVEAAVPTALWDTLAGHASQAPLAPVLRRFKWTTPDELPVLVSATVVIWLSAVGFMWTTYVIIRHQYEAGAATGIAASLVLGVALLGGGGSGHYQWYPYDFTSACVFAVSIALLLRGSPWFLLVFPIAAYAKETAAFLLVAYWLVNRDAFGRKIVVGSALAIVFLLIRVESQTRFPGGGPEFWWPWRNLDVLSWWVVFDSWTMAIVTLASAQLWRLRSEWPPDLRRLTLLIPLFLLAALFKGWVEERRQYLELVVIAGPLALQWADSLAGTALLRPRRAALSPAREACLGPSQVAPFANRPPSVRDNPAPP